MCLEISEPETPSDLAAALKLSARAAATKLFMTVMRSIGVSHQR
jgi:hypothetical protein